MDLTKSYPASVREKMLGIVQLKRTIDKGKAEAQGTAGEYNYDCPMDKHLFDFLGLDGAALLDVIKSAGNDDEISEFVAPYVHAKDDEEIEAFNRDWLTHGPAHRRDDVARSARPRREAFGPPARPRVNVPGGRADVSRRGRVRRHELLRPAVSSRVAHGRR
jgi:hypothetical protein